MEFSIYSGIHILSLMTLTGFITFFTKIIYLIFPVQDDRRRVINSLIMLIGVFLLDYFNIAYYLPWFDLVEYSSAFNAAMVFFSTMFFVSCLDYFVWNGLILIRYEHGVPKILTNILKYFIYFFSILLAAKFIYAVNITAVLAATGIITFIFGYAAQSTLSDFFAGISLQFGGKLKKGDHIKADKVEGKIEEFNWRSVTVKGFRRKIIPNKMLANGIITVYNITDTYYIGVKLHLSPASDINTIVMIANQAMKDSSVYDQSYTAIYNITEQHVVVWCGGMVRDRLDVWGLKHFFYSALTSKAIKNNLLITSSLRHCDVKDFITKAPPKPSQKVVVSALRDMPVLRQLPDQAMTNIYHLADLEFYTEGECISREGETGECLFIIIRGTVDTYKVINNRKEKIRTLPTGSYFGLKSFLTQDKRRVTVKGGDKISWILKINRDKMMEIVADYPEILNQMRKELLARIQIAEEKIKQTALTNTDKNKISQILSRKIKKLFAIKK